ncbi:protein commissureless 2 homolog [Ischnura elegans]|uniref:protein commissureless 2 homolog n=1 Tax=Ischnura elegans TaxID=197161 RepID=UPI001ED89DD2|nr:protein commissureless 2 homolog [Ischnura elegans]
MEQMSLANEDFSRGGHTGKLYVFPVVNGSSLSMFPWKYVDDAEDNQTSLQTLEKGYEQFVADVWVGIVLTLMVLSCLCCICSCLLYHRLLEWKRKVFGPPPTEASTRRESNGSHTSGRSEVESLPSYTVVSGLPSYEEALEQLKMATGEKAQLAAEELPPPPLVAFADQPPPQFSTLYKVEDDMIANR